MVYIERYLHETSSKLYADYFCLDPEVRLFSRFLVKNPKYFDCDYTNGGEPVPIECVNAVNKDPPLPISYQQRRFTDDNNVNLSLACEFLSSCECEDNCYDRSKCACYQLTLSQMRTERIGDPKLGYEFRRLRRGPIYTGIYECNHLCKCRKNCPNKVVQNPLAMRLQLFKTHLCGWGVRTLYDIPKGTFICIYAGNLLSEKRADEVGKTQGDEYFADLDFVDQANHLNMKEGYEETPTVPSIERGRISGVVNLSSDEEDSNSSSNHRNSTKSRKQSNAAGDPNFPAPSKKKKAANRKNQRPPWSLSNYLGEENIYTLDAKVAGNIGRYLNHSCSPNVFVQNVFVDTHSFCLPWVAFFAANRIKAGAELCWDYQYVPGSVPGRNVKCRCGTANCRGRLL